MRWILSKTLSSMCRRLSRVLATRRANFLTICLCPPIAPSLSRRSATMDSWSPAQLKLMELGNNEKLNRFLEKHGVPKTVPAQQKYNTPQALAYREKLKCEAEGREWKKPKSMKASSSSKNIGGGGEERSRGSSSSGGGGGGRGSIAEKAKKAKAPKMKKGQFDLATVRGCPPRGAAGVGRGG